MSSRSSYSWSSRLSPASDRSHFQTVLLQWVPGAETPTARPHTWGPGRMEVPGSTFPSFRQEGPQPEDQSTGSF